MMDHSKEDILFCLGLCGIPDCPLEFKQQIDLSIHTNKVDYENFTTSEQLFCRKCMHFYSSGEVAEDHKCKPIFSNFSDVIIDKDCSLILTENVDKEDKFTLLTETYANTSKQNFPKIPFNHQSIENQEIVGVFWDIENIIIPDCKSPSGVVRVLRDRFVSNKREVEFQCVCDIHKEERYIIDELNSSLVTIVHVACTNKNAADEKLKQLLVKFSNTYQAPATVVLLSGDVNFSPTLSSLKNYNKFHVVLIHNRQCSQALKDTASELHLIDDLIRDVDPPFRLIGYKYYYVLVSGLPNGLVGDWHIRNELNKLCDNTGGKIISTDENRAFIRYHNPDQAARGQKRLNNQSLFGVNIKAKLTIETPFKHTFYSGCQRRSVFRPPFPRMTRPIHTSYNPRSIQYPSNERHESPPQMDQFPFGHTISHSLISNLHCLKLFPYVNRACYEVINQKHIVIESCLNKLNDILYVERSIPLVDSVVLFVRSNLNAGHLIKTIEARNLNLKKLELYEGSIDTVNFHGFIADAFLILSKSRNGWMFVRDFLKNYKVMKSVICPPAYIERIISNNTKIVCGFKDFEIPEMSILANEDCDPNSSFIISDNIIDLELYNTVFTLLNEPQNNGRIHYFDLIPELRRKLGNENFILDPKGFKMKSLLSQIPCISIITESNSGICSMYVLFTARKPTKDDVNSLNLQIVKYMLIEKSDAIHFEMFNRICTELFYLNLKCSSSGFYQYEQILGALEDSITQLVITPKVKCKFADILLLVKQEIWELTSFYGDTGVQLDVLEREYQIKTGHNIPFRACYFNKCEDLLDCIPGLKLLKEGNIRVIFISNYFSEMIASQCIRLLNENPSQSMSVCEFRYLFEKTYEHSIGFQLEDIPQISVRHQNNSRSSSVNLSLQYLGIEISHLLYKQKIYSMPLDTFTDEYKKSYNKILYPSMFGVQSIIELFTMLESYITLERNMVSLLQHRVFACEVCQVLRKLTHPNEPIFISQFHSNFLKIHFKELKLANYNATKLSPLLLKISDVVQLSDVCGDDRSLVLTGLGWYIPEPYTSLPISIKSRKPNVTSSNCFAQFTKTNEKRNKCLVAECEKILFSQPHYSCPVSEFDKLLNSKNDKSLSPEDIYPINIIELSKSFPGYFLNKIVGGLKTVQLTNERVFANECRTLMKFSKNGINLSNFAKEYYDHIEGREFDLTRYGNYTKLTKLLAKVPDSVTLIGPNKSWLISNEYGSKLIEADKQVDICSLTKLIVSILIEKVDELITFDQIPYFHERIHHFAAPEWISVILTCPPLLKMYADLIVDQAKGIQKLMKDKFMFFKLSSKKWEEIFKHNTICLFFRKNRMLFSVGEFSDLYKKDYYSIDLNKLGYTNMDDLLSSRYLQMIQEKEPHSVRLSAEGIQVLFQMQLVEILYNSPDYSLPFEYITSRYYNTYGYNLKLHEMGMTKLTNLLSTLNTIIHISGEGKCKRVTLRYDIVNREKCRQILTDLSIENRFPLNFSLFSHRFYFKFKDRCSLQMILDSASNVVHVLGQPSCNQITPAFNSYPYREPQNIPRLYKLSTSTTQSPETCLTKNSNNQHLDVSGSFAEEFLSNPLNEHSITRIHLINDPITFTKNNNYSKSQTQVIDEIEPTKEELSQKTHVDSTNTYSTSKNKINLAAKFTLMDDIC